MVTCQNFQFSNQFRKFSFLQLKSKRQMMFNTNPKKKNAKLAVQIVTSVAHDWSVESQLSNSQSRKKSHAQRVKVDKQQNIENLFYPPNIFSEAINSELLANFGATIPRKISHNLVITVGLIQYNRFSQKIFLLVQTNGDHKFIRGNSPRLQNYFSSVSGVFIGQKWRENTRRDIYIASYYVSRKSCKLTKSTILLFKLTFISRHFTNFASRAIILSLPVSPPIKIFFIDPITLFYEAPEYRNNHPDQRFHCWCSKRHRLKTQNRKHTQLQWYWKLHRSNATKVSEVLRISRWKSNYPDFLELRNVPLFFAIIWDCKSKCRCYKLKKKEEIYRCVLQLQISL